MNVQGIRSELVLWLSKTRAASRDWSPDTVKKYCEKLGITEELLREAHMLRVKNDFELHNSKGRHADYVSRKVKDQEGLNTLVAHCSRELKQYMVEHCKPLNIALGSFARSVIHHYLRGSWEPESITRDWSFRNFNGDQKANRATNLHVSVSRAAKEVFVKRAQALGVNATSLFREVISAAVNGDFAQPGTIRYISKSQMYSREELYHLPD